VPKNQGLPIPAPIDKKSTPKQTCNLPYEGDPFCGNDNNRRAFERRNKKNAAAQSLAKPEAQIEDNKGNVEKPEEKGATTDPSTGESTPAPKAPASAPMWKPGT
jgi:hypothetical protein